MKKLKLNLLFCFIILAVSGIAQQSINNIININFNNINPIKEGEKTKGYYVFYKADKVKGGEYSYRLRILNESAEKVAEKRIVASKYLYLLEATYNQELLCFKFYDGKTKKVSLRFYNDKAEKVYTKTIEPSKMERQMIAVRTSQGIENSAPSITPIEKVGFVQTSIVKNNKLGYEIQFYPNNKEQKGWKYGSKSSSPVLEFAGIIEANKDIIFATVGIKKSLMSKKVDFQLLALDSKTGKELFKKKMDSQRYEESITNSYYDEEKKQLITFGYYFKKGDNPISDPSIGIVIKTLDKTGKEVDVKYTSWSKDIAKYLGPSKKGKLDEIGFIYFHQFVRLEDGTFYGIGESYRKTVSAAGSATKILAMASGGSGGSAFQISVRDFYIFEFDKDKNVTGVEVVEKSVSRIGLPNGAGIYGPQIMASMVKAYGGFDFEYIKTLNNGKTFAVFYRDFEKKKGEKNKSIAGVVSKTGKEDYIIDKIDIPTDATYMKVLPANDGNILFLEYFKKTKKLEMNFQKMNY